MNQFLPSPDTYTFTTPPHQRDFSFQNVSIPPTEAVKGGYILNVSKYSTFSLEMVPSKNIFAQARVVVLSSK